MKNILSAIEDDRQEFLENFYRGQGSTKMQPSVPINLNQRSTKNLVQNQLRRVKNPALLKSLQEQPALIQEIQSKYITPTHEQYTSQIFKLPRIK